MNDTNKTNFFYFCFLLLIIFSLIQGYYCKYFSFRVCNEFFKNYWTENGFIENLQVIFVLTSKGINYFEDLDSFKYEIDITNGFDVLVFNNDGLRINTFEDERRCCPIPPISGNIILREYRSKSSIFMDSSYLFKKIQFSAAGKINNR